MFGKPISAYLAFQKPILIAMIVVGLIRLAISIAGVPDATARYFSITVIALAGVVYYGIAVHTRGFGSFKQLLPLVFFQTVVANLIAVLGILLSIAGLHNIFGAPEYSGPAATNQWLHAGAHLTIGMILPTVMTWIMASIILLITRLVVRRPA